MKRSKLATFAITTAITTAIAAALTGCGDDDGGDSSAFAEESATDIVEAAKTAMGELESVHLEGEITTDGSTITMDLSPSTSGNCEGSVSIDGGGLEVLQVDGDSWFKADAAFWQQQAPDQADQIIAAVGDKWVIDAEGQFTSFCDLQSFLDEIIEDDDDSDTFEKDGTDEVDGEEAVKITGDDSTAYIATDEPHYILKLEGSGEEDEGAMTFSAFDEEIDVEAPAEDDTIDLAQLG